MINVTANAIKQIEEICKEDGVKYVRTFIEGGGCSGFNYGFAMDDEKEEDDILIADKLIIDSMSMQYLEGATIDYISDRLNGSRFVINNPNAKATCGCGSSFAV